MSQYSTMMKTPANPKIAALVHALSDVLISEGTTEEFDEACKPLFALLVSEKIVSEIEMAGAWVDLILPGEHIDIEGCMEPFRVFVDGSVMRLDQ